MSKVTGKVAQIVGPVIDVEFAAGSELPKIYDSLEINNQDGSKLVLEVFFSFFFSLVVQLPLIKFVVQSEKLIKLRSLRYFEGTCLYDKL